MNKRGYTLVEAVICLAALAVLSLVGTGLFLVFRMLWKFGS